MDTEVRLSMAARVEITKKYAAAYQGATKKQKTLILNQVVALTGWNRDHARQRLKARLKAAPRPGRASVGVLDRRKTKAFKYSYDARLVLRRVWAACGGSCGQYLAPAMEHWLDAMEAEGSLVVGQGRYSAQVREELLAMSAATIDRYLTPIRASVPRLRT